MIVVGIIAKHWTPPEIRCTNVQHVAVLDDSKVKPVIGQLEFGEAKSKMKKEKSRRRKIRGTCWFISTWTDFYFLIFWRAAMGLWNLVKLCVICSTPGCNALFNLFVLDISHLPGILREVGYHVWTKVWSPPINRIKLKRWGLHVLLVFDKLIISCRAGAAV